MSEPAPATRRAQLHAPRPWRAWRGWALAAAIFALCAGLRLGLLERQGLWTDELFSLAMATGHSLEHAPELADPARGDFVEHPDPVPLARYARYARPEPGGTTPAAVVEAVRRSDTSPPLYYLLLAAWIEVAGTGDVALRGFSVLWSLLAFPFLWSIAREAGGRPAAVSTCALYGAAPLSLFYATEGRMYSLLTLWVVLAVWLSLRLRRRGVSPGLAAAWLAVGAAGFLTHYFFAFFWAGLVVWLYLHPARLCRARLAVGAVLALVVALPWYVHVPGTLGAWRVTAGWLEIEPWGHHPLGTTLALPWSFLAVKGIWGVRPVADWAAGGLYALTAAVVIARGQGRLRPSRRRLLALWLLAPCLGVVVFDQLMGTYAKHHARYAVAAMPGAYLLVGVGLARLGPRLRYALLALLLLACAVGVQRIYRNDARNSQQYREAGRDLAGRLAPGDLVIVHSIPSGVAGMARALERAGAPDGVDLAAWVGQLGRRRVPDDVRRLSAGRERVFLVAVHTVGDPVDEGDWLAARATSSERWWLEAVEVRAFTFPPGGPPIEPVAREDAP